MEITFENLPNAVYQLSNEIRDLKLLILEKSNEPKNDSDQLLTIKQAGELLGLSVPTLYSKVHFAEIPVCKRGKRLYFSKHELLLWIKEGRKKSNNELKADAYNYLKKK